MEYAKHKKQINEVKAALLEAIQSVGDKKEDDLTYFEINLALIEVMRIINNLELESFFETQE